MNGNHTAGNKKIGLFFATLAFTFWGISYLFCGVALKTAIPEVILAVRFTYAFVIMTIIIMVRKEKISLKGKNVARLLLVGIFEPVMSFFLETYGMLYTNASFAGIMVAMNPIIAFFFAMVFLKERTTWKDRIFMVVATFGVLLATYSGGGETNPIRPIGVVMLVAACFCNAEAKVINKRIINEFSAFERTYALMGVSCVAFVSLAVLRGIQDPAVILTPICTPSFLLSTLALAVFCSVGAFFAMNKALDNLPVSRIVVFAGLTTIVSIVTCAIFLHEKITIFSVIGAALVILSIWNINK